jgi:outer membrane immunogenic protein
MPPAPLPYSWTGCYVGIQAGGSLETDSTFSQAGVFGNGAIAGGQVGCNYQTGMLVFGIEGEGFWSSLRSQTSLVDSSEDNSEVLTTSNRWDADVAARLGVAFDRTLFYSKFGVAWGRRSHSDRHR